MMTNNMDIIKLKAALNTKLNQLTVLAGETASLLSENNVANMGIDQATIKLIEAKLWIVHAMSLIVQGEQNTKNN